MHQIRFAPGLRPGPRWGSSRRSPTPLVGWGGETPSPYLTPRRLRRLGPGAFGACCFGPNLFFVPARLTKCVTAYNRIRHRITVQPDLVFRLVRTNAHGRCALNRASVGKLTESTFRYIRRPLYIM